MKDIIELSHLQQIDKALGWLKVVEDNELATVWSYKIHRLPDPNSGFSYYHWTEYNPDNQSLELCFDDIIITRK